MTRRLWIRSSYTRILRALGAIVAGKYGYMTYAFMQRVQVCIVENNPGQSKPITVYKHRKLGR